MGTNRLFRVMGTLAAVSAVGCTAGRASFLTGQHDLRTGLTKAGLPGATLGFGKKTRRSPDTFRIRPMRNGTRATRISGVTNPIVEYVRPRAPRVQGERT